MALITCQECGAEVSTAARTCPNCGAKGRTLTGKRSPVAKVGIGLLVILGAGAVISTATQIANPKQPTKPAQAAENEADADRNARIITYARSLKASARNPDSLIYEHIFSNADGNLVCFKVRAQNGFGGMNRETYAFSPAGGSPKPNIVKTICRDKVMKDVSDDALPLIKPLDSVADSGVSHTPASRRARCRE